MLFGRLRDVGVEVEILARPVEVEVAIPFAGDVEHASYDGEMCSASGGPWWPPITSSNRLRSGFVGKSNPVQFFWGSFDLAVTRFSWGPAPQRR